MQFDDDGSLTMSRLRRLPDRDSRSPNWLPTPQGKKYNITYRFYGPTKDLTNGKYFPPPLVRISQTRTEQLILSPEEIIT